MLLFIRKLTQGLFALAVVVIAARMVERPLAAAERPADRDEELLKESGVTIDADSLAELLRSRSPEGVDLDKLGRLVEQWRSDEFPLREQASEELLKWGWLVRDKVEKAAQDSDAEVVDRAQKVLKKINREIYLAQPLLAVRLLAKRWPEKAVAPLLLHLPFALEETAEEIVFALDALVVKQGQVPAAMVKALQDKTAARRAAAAVIVGRRGSAEQKAAVAKLLTDAAPMVRLRAAQGLLAAKDKVGLPTLVALVDEPDVAVSWSAEELLHWVAEETAPEAVVGAATAEERQKCRAAWEAWHKVHGDKVDVGKRYAEVRRPGLCLVGAKHPKPDRDDGQVYLRGCDGKPRWKIAAPWAGDAFLLPGNRISLVWRELDLHGRELWRSKIGGTSRLPNGNLFTDGGYLNSREVTRAGELVVEYLGLTMAQGEEHALPSQLCGEGAVRKLGDGRLMWLYDKSGLGEHDAETGRLVKKVPLDPKLKRIEPIDVLPNGHWLVRWSPEPEPPAEKKPWLERQTWLVEVDTTGKAIWQSRVCAIWAVRLRNGHTLAFAGLVGDITRAHHALVELDRTGKRLWEDYSTPIITRVRECLPLVSLGFDEPPVSPPDVESVEHRIEGLKDKDEKVRHRSVLFLKEMGPEAWIKVMPDLLEALGDSDAMIQSQAKQMLEWLGRDALPTVLEGLSDKRPAVRANAVMVICGLRYGGKIPPEEEKPIAAKLLTAIRDEDAAVRQQALTALAGFTSLSEEIVPALLHALKDREATVRRQAVFALAGFAGQSEQALLAMIEALQDKDLGAGGVSAYAALELGYLKQPTPKVMAALIEATRAPDDQLRGNALIGVGRLAGKDRTFAPEAVKALVAALRGKDYLEEKTADSYPLRASAATGLGLIGAEAKGAVPDLIAALRAEGAEDDDAVTKIRPSVMAALEAIGPDAKAAVSCLIEIVRNKDSSPEERKKAVEALKKIDPGVKLPEFPNR
jgi:HEAT repeat protein